MTGLIVAMNREAAPFFARAGISACGDESVARMYDLRPARQLVMCVCGMGPGNAVAACERLITEYAVNSVLNAGAAGAVRDGAGISTIYRVSRVWMWPEHEDSLDCVVDLFPDLPTAVIATVCEPVFDNLLRREIGRNAELVDMECAAIARVCAARKIRFSAFKGVTDLAGPGDRKGLMANLDKVCEDLASLIWPVLI